MTRRLSVAAAALMLWPQASAFALDASVGGVGVGADSGGVSAGVGGASVGVGTGGVSVGGVGSVDPGATGATDSSSTGSSSSGPGGAGSSGSGSTGSSASASAGASGSASAGAATAGGTGSEIGATQRGRSAASIGLALPGSLRPRGEDLLLRLQGEGGPSPLVGREGAPTEIVSACRQTVARAAQPYGLVDLSVISNGRLRPVAGGGQLAPILTRIVYQRQGGYEMRQAPIYCHIDASGRVSGLHDAG